MNVFSSSFELGKLSGPGQCEPIHTARTESVLGELNEPNEWWHRRLTFVV